MNELWQNKWVQVFIIWLFVLIAYLFMAAAMPAIREISSAAATDIAASGNMTTMVHVDKAVSSSSVWLWFIPAPIGFIASVWVLKVRDMIRR